MFGLSFLFPLFLAGLAAIAIPIALHLFRRRTETVVDFPAVRLLQKAPVEQQRRRRLRELVLLALRIAALALLALAFARPYIASSSAVLPAPITVVALDTSLSLSAPGQFDAARQAAKRAVETSPATHAVGLMTFADSPTVVVAPTTDRGAVMSAIDAVKPTAGGTRFRTALGQAAELVTADDGRIVVVTDLQQVGWESADEGAVPDGIGVEAVAIQPPASNVAVTTARRERQAVVVALHNFGRQSARVPVRLIVDGRDVATETVEVTAEAAGEVRLSATLPPRGAAEVRIDDAAGYAGDNSRFVVLDPPAAIPIIVVTAEPPQSSNSGLYVERALTVAEEGRAFAPRVLDGRAFSALTTEQFGTPGAIVLLGTTTLDRKGRESVAAFLKGGGRVLLTLGPDLDVETLSDTVGVSIDVEPQIAETTDRTVTLVAADGRHPMFRPFASSTGALGDIYIERYRRLRDRGGRTVLARFSGAGSAVTEEAVERGRLLLFASDLDNRWNRFPLNPAFVPWIVETVRYLTAGRGQRQSYTLPDIPPGAQAAPGVYESASMPGVRFAVNPDVRESNPARTSVEEFTGAITRLNRVAAVRAHAAATEQEERQRLWQLTLFVMLMALAAEGLIGRRAS
jgi:hypothetical protein